MYCPSNRSADRLDGQYVQRNENARRLDTNFGYFLFAFIENGPAALLEKKFSSDSARSNHGPMYIGLRLMKNGAKNFLSQISSRNITSYTIGLYISHLVQGDNIYALYFTMLMGDICERKFSAIFQ